ncbi:MAG: hypothetical protein ACR2GD_09625, partial [Pyrinomonadaceae bacterium]
QTKGLFGERDRHTKILNIYFPQVNKTDEKHLRLAEISRKCHDKAQEFLRLNPPASNLAPIKLGRIRLDIKKYLADEMKQIDSLVAKLIK